VAKHFERDNDAHVDRGTTRRDGVPIKLDRRLIEAELKIATGLVEPHFMAGYSGGRKVIAPGVAHKDTITTLHSARFMEHPKAANCVLDGNPLYEAQLEIVAMLGGALALNTVIDEERRLSFVNFGEIALSHLEAVAHAREFTEVPVAEKFRTVVTSAAGYPLDKTYYQTVKGMVAPMPIMAEGADLIIASACSEGMGSREFVDTQRRLVERGPDRVRRVGHVGVLERLPVSLQRRPSAAATALTPRIRRSRGSSFIKLANPLPSPPSTSVAGTRIS
jgi:nickel-dependent lactate racemase